MDTKQKIIKMWQYLSDAFEKEEISAAIEELEFPVEDLEPYNLDQMTEEELLGLLFDLSYMAANGLFGGDLYAWNEVLVYSLQFDNEILGFLDY